MSLSDRLGLNDPNQEAYPTTSSLRALADVTQNEINHAKFRQLVSDELKSLVGQKLYSGNILHDELEQTVYQAINNVLDASDEALTTFDRAGLVQEIVDDILGNGPIEQLLRDPEVTEIMVARFDQVYVERRGKITLTPLTFEDEDHLRRAIDRIVGKVGRRIDESSPLVDARLADGSRVNAAVPPIALDGANLTIRKFFKEPFTARDMLATGTLPEKALELLEACVRGRLNIVISGGTGSGKTTTLNVLSGFIPDDERIVTIEDSAELQLAKPHVIRLESRPANIEGSGLVTIRDLVRNSLRMRPDRIVVGEVRDGAAMDMLQAMNTGHDGSLTTVHANTPVDAVSRLETMGLMAGMELPVTVIRDQITRAIDLIVQQARLRDGSRKIVAISQMVRNETGGFELEDLYRFEYHATANAQGLGELKVTSAKPNFLNRLTERGVTFTPEALKK